MAPSEKRTGIIGLLVEGQPPPTIPGCTQHTCSRCGRATWLAPKGVARIEEEGGIPIFCSECGNKLIYEDADKGELEIQAVDPKEQAAVEEAVRHLLEDYEQRKHTYL